MNSSKRSSLFFHVIILFIFVLILTGVITYAQQRGLPVFGPFDVAANGASAAVVDFFDSVWGEGKEEE